MSYTQTQIDNAETALAESNIKSVKIGDKLLWKQDADEQIEKIDHMKRVKNEADAVAAGARSSKYSLANFVG